MDHSHTRYRWWYWWGGTYYSRIESRPIASTKYKELESVAGGRLQDHILHQVISYPILVTSQIIPNFLANLTQYNNSIRPIVYRIHLNVLVTNTKINYLALSHRLIDDLPYLKHYQITHQLRWRKRKRSLLSFLPRIRLTGTITIKMAFNTPSVHHLTPNFSFDQMSPQDCLVITDTYRHLD